MTHDQIEIISTVADDSNSGGLIFARGNDVMSRQSLGNWLSLPKVILSVGAMLLSNSIVTAAISIMQSQISWVRIFLIGLVIWAVFSVIRHFGSRWLIEAEIQPKTGPAPLKRGLIVLVSPGKDIETSAAMAAIRHHYRGENEERATPTLEYLWLVCSRQYEEEPEKTQSSFRNAELLKREYTPLLNDVFQVPVADPDSPMAVFNCVQHCYAEADRLGLKDEDVMADVTGGTKSMSVGVAYAAIPKTRDMQFMKPRGYTDDGRARVDLGSDAQSIDVDFVERLPWFKAG